MLHKEHNTSEVSPSSPPPTISMEEVSINIQEYLLAIIKDWKLIGGAALLGGVLALIFAFFQPVTYSTVANVTLLNIRSSIVFDSAFTTVPLEGAATQQDNRGEALKALAESPALLNQVYSQIRSQLADGSPATLDNQVLVNAEGDLVQLTVQWSNPSDAALIANEWARRYVDTANKAYVSTSSNTPEDAELTAQTAFERYQEVQKEYEAFLAANDLDRLESDIVELNLLLERLRELKSHALVLLNTTNVAANTQLVNATNATLQAGIEQSIQREAAERTRELNRWYTRRDELKELRYTLVDIQAQLESGDDRLQAADIGDFLAVMLVRAGIQTNREGTDGNPLQLQVDLDQLIESGDNLTSEQVASLLSTVDANLQQTEEEITRLSNDLFLGTGFTTPAAIPDNHALLSLVQSQVEEILNSSVPLEAASTIEESPLSQTVEQVSAQRQALYARLEEAQAQQRELLRNRDTAWELYTTLDNKAREAEAQFATGAPQARLALTAFTPTEADPSSRVTFAILGVFGGALLALLYVLAKVTWPMIFVIPSLAPLPGEPQSAGD